MPRLPVALWVLLSAAIALPFADLGLGHHSPWAELGRMASGALRPDFTRIEDLGRALALTVAFAVAGVGLGALAGAIMAPFYRLAPVRAFCIAIRSVHELFWALFLMQGLGLSALTGVLALALPYAGIFAKVFAERFETLPRAAYDGLPPNLPGLVRLCWVAVPSTWPALWSYTLYRMECGLRSSAVLGFIGLPTLGFQLDSFFKLGAYGAASAILICYIALIASMRWWMRPRLVLIWAIAAAALLLSLSSPPMGQGAFWRFLTQDIVPAPLRNGGDLGAWLWSLLAHEAWPGILATLIVTQIALAATAAVALSSFGLAVRRVTGTWGHRAGQALLIVMRSLPEYMLAYLFLQALGPSMLPAILALALHNGGIIAHLMARDATDLAPTLRQDAPRGMTHWGWDLLPRLSGPFWALLLYRWEIILRETAVMGLLGVATLGFYIDSAMAELRIDRALVLLAATALLTATVDWLSRRLRKAAH